MKTSVTIPMDASVSNEMISWLVDVILDEGDEWVIESNVMTFKHEADAIAFKLKFQL